MIVKFCLVLFAFQITNKCLYVYFICSDYVGNWPQNKQDCFQYFSDCRDKYVLEDNNTETNSLPNRLPALDMINVESSTTSSTNEISTLPGFVVEQPTTAFDLFEGDENTEQSSAVDTFEPQNGNFTGKTCLDHRLSGALVSGEYILDVENENVRVFCDMTTDGGGWTVFQRRGDFGRGKNFFLRSWEDYRRGFGYPTEDFWLGLENLYELTKQEEIQLLIELEDFDGNRTSLLVNNFTLGNEDNGYKISYKNYNSQIGNSLPARGTKFSTIDRDNDAWTQNCAKRFSGAWWYSACHNSNLNGLYLRGKHESFGNGVNWYHWKGYHYSLKSTEMKIRPRRN
eukprot:maker-scaffold781_size98004-snap-gene-0.21 protein:Tk03282 transcript:maker-scaffold781_size98004-snap-gene-0.21-mRNA-1 annotation:"techylectin-5b precursor"